MEKWDMGKHTIKRNIWKNINNQKSDGCLPEWMGLVFIAAVFIVILVMSFK